MRVVHEKRASAKGDLNGHAARHRKYGDNQSNNYLAYFGDERAGVTLINMNQMQT